jgi:hypothetical protein
MNIPIPEIAALQTSFKIQNYDFLKKTAVILITFSVIYEDYLPK